MNNFKKVAVLAVSAIIFAAFAVPSYAAINIHISGNGAGSLNDVRVLSEQKMQIFQQNVADIRNSIRSHANTGNNDANFNTGGHTAIHTGNSSVSTTISNALNFNHASIHTCHDCNGGSGGNGNTHTNFSKKFHVWLNGAQEVPGPGDPNGWGRAKVVVDPESKKLCVNMHVFNIDPATAAHLHQAPAGSSGPVVFHLPTPDANGHSHGCVDADMDKLKEVRDNPSNFYINVHNSPYPDGAVRGQLSH